MTRHSRVLSIRANLTITETARDSRRGPGNRYHALNCNNGKKPAPNIDFGSARSVLRCGSFPIVAAAGRSEFADLPEAARRRRATQTTRDPLVLLVRHRAIDSTAAAHNGPRHDCVGRAFGRRIAEKNVWRAGRSGMQKSRASPTTIIHPSNALVVAVVDAPSSDAMD